MTSNPPLISIVIPVYGSEAILPELTKQLDEAMRAESWDYEVIYVCDHSPDDSWSVIVSLAEEFDTVRGILLRVNAGQHNAVMAGLSEARGAVIVTMDDDLQHSPADIPRLVSEVLDGGFDVAYAVFPDRKHPLWKVFGSAANDAIAERLIRKPRNLYLAPFRAFSAAIKDELVAYHGPYVYLDGIILRVTRHITAVSVTHHPRFSGRSRYGLRKSISLLLKMATNFSITPLRVTSVVGIVTAGLGFLLALFFIFQRLTGEVVLEGWSSLMVAILVVGGVNLVAIGVLGEYLGRVLLTINGQPQYVVAARIGTSSRIPGKE